MDKIAEEIFVRKKPNFNKLMLFGFKKQQNSYVWHTKIVDDQFELSVIIGTNGSVETRLLELSVNEEYTLFLADDAVGNFVGNVRQQYQNVLKTIADECFEREVFKSEYAKQITDYAYKKYGDELEYLWDKFPYNAVLRRKDTIKWYAIILTIPYKTLGVNSTEKVEIIDMRMQPEDVQKLVDNKTIFGGYHMNKKHWITICLDGSVSIEKIKQLLDSSYVLSK